VVNKISVELSSYEASNLLSLLDALWNNAQRGGLERKLQEFNTGDWVGEVPMALVSAMMKGGKEFLDNEPNGVWQEEMPTTRQMVIRCGIGDSCPHCGSSL